MKIAVMGSGSWGLAMAKHLHGLGHKITLWSFLETEAQMLAEKRCNEALLPGVLLPEDIQITTQVDFVAGCEIVVMATPSYGVAELAQRLKPHMTVAHTAVILSKGFDAKSGYCLFSETLDRAWDGMVPLVAVTGPSHAEEVARGVPTAVVAASGSSASALLVQEAFMSESLRVYTSADILGAELGGAMKNIMALAVGISDGYGYGDNTKAMLMTRGIAEMSRLGVWLGGKAETFSGLSGVGDLIVTCISQHSRNRRAGLLIGGGMPVAEALESVGAVVEGYFATEAVHTLVKGQVDLPICNAMYALLFEGVPIERAAVNILSRGGRPESDLDLRQQGFYSMEDKVEDLTTVRLSTPRTCLIPLCSLHVPELLEHYDRETARHMNLEPFGNEDEASDYVARRRVEMKAGNSLTMAIAEGERLLGCVELRNLNGAMPAIGIWLRAGVRGKGYGAEAVGEVIAFARHRLGAERFLYRTLESNAPSMRAIEKWGGRLTDTVKTSRDGEMVTVLEYQIF